MSETAGKAYQLSNPCLFLDLCQLSSPELGPVCHDREDAGTVSGPQAPPFALPKLVRSSSQALIKGLPHNFTRLGHKTSIYFYFETPDFLLFLLFLYSRSQPCYCNTFMCVHVSLFAINVFFSICSSDRQPKASF